MDSKVLISGPGRSGTSFIVQLLTGLGLNTGFSDMFDRFNRKTYSGMETHIEDDPTQWEGLPRFVKDPELCFRLKGLTQAGFKVEHVIIPVRDLELAARSRESRRVYWRNENWHKRCGTMERFLASALGELVTTLILYKIPHTFLTFPEIVEDPSHMWEKLPWVFEGIPREAYDDVFNHLLNFAPKDSVR